MTETIPAEGRRRLHDAVADRVGKGELPGLVTLLARGDEVHVDTIGIALALTQTSDFLFNGGRAEFTALAIEAAGPGPRRE